MANKKQYLVGAEFYSIIQADPNDIKNENYDEIVNKFSEALMEKIRNNEVLDNIVSIEEEG